MAKDKLVSADSVFKAADRIVAEGRKPSLRAVRRQLGGGSFGTILPFLQSWKRARAGERAADDDSPRPLSPAVAAALDHLVTAAAEVAEAVHTAQMAPVGDTDEDDDDGDADALREEIAELQRMALDQITQLRGERDNLAEQLTQARAELQELRAWRERAVAHMRSLSAKVIE